MNTKPMTPAAGQRFAWRDAPPRDDRARGLARALGWISIGLGAVELLAPRGVARSTGMTPADTLLRGYGAREMATGAALLSSSSAEPWLWARVAGDVVDIATVGSRLRKRPRAARRGAATMLALLGVMALDVACAAALRRERRRQQRRQPIDFAQRSGFSQPPSMMRGVARREGQSAVDRGSMDARQRAADAALR